MYDEPSYSYDAPAFMYDSDAPAYGGAEYGAFTAHVWSIDKFTGKERDTETGLDHFGG
ncbi:MAG TPA: hypothetical protein VN577_04905 [Terriglobales bacterium]|nr:hypothetical protein [Terriglobales bacterium]